MPDLLPLVLTPPENSLLYQGHYDFLLVTLSVGIAVLAAHTSFLVSHYVAAGKSPAMKRLWTLVGGLCMGAGVWAMHFSGMLAFSLPCTTTYDPSITLLSMIPAVLACSLAVGIISHSQIQRRQLLAGGLLMGAGIGTMHYVGMAAYRLDGMVRYDLKLFLLSLLVAVGLATLALWVKFRIQSWQARWRTFAPSVGALVMGLAVSGMHYTAMTSAYFLRNGEGPLVAPQLAPSFVASIVLVVTSSIILTTLATTFLTRPAVFSFSGVYKSIAILIAGWAVVAWIGAGLYSKQSAERNYRDGFDQARRQLFGVGENINDTLVILSGLPEVLAAEPSLRNALTQRRPAGLPEDVAERKRRWSGDPELAKLNAYLATTAANLNVDVIWVVNDAGDCIAASNAEHPTSFIGTHYSDRQYFRQAQAGLRSQQYAVGRVTKVPGLYYSSPVLDHGRFLGAVVVKRDIADLTHHVRSANAFIADANGVIVMALDQHILNRTLPNTRVQALSQAERLLQYNQVDFAPLDIRPWGDSAFPDLMLLGADPLPQVLISRTLVGSTITLYVARPLPELARIEAEKPWIFLVIGIAGSMLIIAVTALALNVRATRAARDSAQAAVVQLEQHKRQLELIAHYDVVTGLPNRTLLSDRMEQAIIQTQRSGDLMAVCYLDLDSFKPVNDRFGHDVGDRMLVEVAGRLKDCLRGSDTVARMGGDEFVLLLLGLVESEEWQKVLRRILESVALPVVIGRQTVAISASLGVTVYPWDNADGDTLVRHADQAMYIAKQGGKNRYHFFDPEEDRRTRDHLEQVAGIEVALRNEQFVLYYQPKVNMRQGQVFGAEALIRWLHPERGLLPPGAFLPAVEHTDWIVAIGDWGIAAALRQVAAWHQQGLELTVSVNIAARHLLREDFVSRLKDHLAACPDAPWGCLELEVLETAALGEIEHVARIIRECREIGVHFALDDFGTGYSSLTYLKLLPADTLKIDQSFIRNMDSDPEDLAIVQGIIGLAQVFQRQVVAEGVETLDHGALLLSLGCERAQGYGIARPMPGADLPDWARRWRPDPSWTGDALVAVPV